MSSRTTRVCGWLRLWDFAGPLISTELLNSYNIFTTDNFYTKTLYMIPHSEMMHVTHTANYRMQNQPDMEVLMT